MIARGSRPNKFLKIENNGGIFDVKFLKYKSLIIDGCFSQNQLFINTLFYQHFIDKLLALEKI